MISNLGDASRGPRRAADFRSRDPNHAFLYKLQEGGTYPYARGSELNIITLMCKTDARVRAVSKRVRAQDNLKVIVLYF